MMNQFNSLNPYGYQPQYQQQFQKMQRLMKCFPVTSIEEARAAMVDIDGSVTVFPDVAHGKIYTKSVDLNGMAVLQTYELINNAQPQISPEQRMDQLEAMVINLKEELENVKQSNIATGKSVTRKTKSASVNEPDVGE